MNIFRLNSCILHIEFYILSLAFYFSLTLLLSHSQSEQRFSIFRPKKPLVANQDSKLVICDPITLSNFLYLKKLSVKLSQVRLYVIYNNNFTLKISNLMTFSNFLYLKKWSVKLVFCPINISGGCHKSHPNYIFLPSWQPHKNFH